MAEENKEVTQEVTEQPIEKKEKQPRNKKGQFAKKEVDDNVIKVDLSKPPKTENEEVEKQPVEEEVVVVNKEPEPVKEEVVEDKQPEPVLEEITIDDLKEPEKVEEKIEEAVIKAEETGQPLPEQLQKVVEFMNETGGDLNDYVNLNRDIEKMDDSDVLDEYYRSTKSHLSQEERGFLLEDTFGIDEEIDDERSIRKKKIALKEQVAEARAYLDGQRSKYYEDIKAGSKLTNEQQKAIDFFNRYNKESEQQNKTREANKQSFLNKTNKVFNEDFKGFDYQVGDKKFRFNVKDTNEIKEFQSDPKNFFNKFVENDEMVDPNGYHKSVFTAMNADAIAKHFYEQGKADAVKDQVARDKNIDMNPRGTHGETEAGGMKFRVLGDSADDFKFKIRKNRK